MGDTSWEESSLCKWLNNDFLNSAFSSEEQDMILLSDVTADENPEHKGTNKGYDADDKVFLLSIKEVEKYFNSDKDRGCKPMRHAICNGVLIDEDKGQCWWWWWLRSLGKLNNLAAYVATDGSVRCDGYDVDFELYAVRPALWTNLKS